MPVVISIAPLSSSAVNARPRGVLAIVPDFRMGPDVGSSGYSKNLSAQNESTGWLSSAPGLPEPPAFQNLASRPPNHAMEMRVASGSRSPPPRRNPEFRGFRPTDVAAQNLRASM